jgi:trehalose/maltose hydrolase-like predicted phosphorylase
MKTSQSLSEALGIEHLTVSEETEILLPAVVDQQPSVMLDHPDQEEDYQLARKTFRALITKGNDAIEGISDLAKESESPRAYEVMATLMKTVADTTKDLYALQKMTKELKTEDKVRPSEEQRINVEKAVFVGSTAELLRQVKNQ